MLLLSGLGGHEVQQSQNCLFGWFDIISVLSHSSVTSCTQAQKRNEAEDDDDEDEEEVPNSCNLVSCLWSCLKIFGAVPRCTPFAQLSLEKQLIGVLFYLQSA